MSFISRDIRVSKILLFALLLISNVSYSQKNIETDVTNVSKVTFFNPGLSYEARIGRHQTLYGQVFMNTSVSYSYSSNFGSSSTLYIDPAVTIQYRYYYNQKRRENAGKRIQMNSLNYVSGIFETVFSKARVKSSTYDENNRRPINHLGFVWGLQRNYKKRFSLDLNLGLGYLFAKQTTINFYNNQTIKENVGMLTPLGQINLGIWLNKIK